MEHRIYSLRFELPAVLIMLLVLASACTLFRPGAGTQLETVSLRFHDDGKFRIAQFTDIHWENDSVEKCAHAARLIRHVLKEEQPDLAVLTGDIVVQSSAEGWKAVTALFTEAGIPFAVVMGNHDDEAEWSRERIFDFLETVDGFVGSKGPASVSGVGNYIIGIGSSFGSSGLTAATTSSRTFGSSASSGNAASAASSSSSSSSTSGGTAATVLSGTSASSTASSVKSGKAASTNASGSTAALLYFLDSNSYGGDEKISTYGWIKFDQIAWYREQSRRLTALNAGKPYPALAFFHIPLPEYSEVAGKEQTVGIKKEEECSPKINTGMLAAFVEMKDVMGTFVGHDHDNNYIGIHKGIALAYGQKTGFGSYGSIGRGSRIIELREGERSFNTWIRTLEGTSYPYNYPSGKSLAVQGQQAETITSPGGFLSMSVIVDDSGDKKGQLTYTIDYKGKPVMLTSDLGITGWESDMEIENSTVQFCDTFWHPVYGERATVRDHFNGKTITLKKNNTGQKLQLIIRAYNEGIAFRYFFPEHPDQGGAYLTIHSEKTTFSVPDSTLAWVTYRAQHEYQLLPVKEWKDEAERPLTLQLSNGLYASLAEAGMVNYSRTKFKLLPGEQNVIRCAMYGPVEEIAPFATPWRVVMVAEKPTALLANNDLILTLNPPCEIENPGWIRPGKVMRAVTLTTEGAKRVVDFAEKRHLDYVHLDAGWYGAENSIASDPTKSDVDPKRSKINDLNVPEVVSYARSKGIGVWLYVNQRALVNYLDTILPLYESWGIAGIKFGFVHVGSHRWTTWLHEAVKKCADHHLMVDIHDEYRPTGFSRTYPNLLTQEGVRGNEEFPDGFNNTVLPFTRYLAGAADATVCYYHRKELKPNLATSMNARSLLNTACHQMALSVINYSPLQFLYWYDTPGDAQDEPELEFFDRLPTVWDDTKIPDGKIGEYIIMARRKGDQWFVAAITNNEARAISIPLDFLETGRTYKMTTYTDGGPEVKTRTHVQIETRKVNAGNTLTFDLQPQGGCTMIISLL